MNAPRRVAALLLHHPVLDRGGQIVTTAITNLDLHDLARSAHCFGLTDLFVAHPVAAQRELAQRVRDHWTTGSGARRIPDRKPALEILRITSSLEDAVEALGGEGNVETWTTSAKSEPTTRLDYPAARQLLCTSGPPVLIVLGTGWGLAPQVTARADVHLDPITSPRADGFNHLSVRAAGAIIFDRLLGRGGGRVMTERLRPDGAFWRRLAYAGARRGPQWWLRHSPPWFGIAFAVALPRERAVVRGNLRRVLGVRDAAREQLDVSRTFASYAHCLAESLAMERPEAQALRHRVCGEETLREAVQAGRGLVVGTAHLGAWDVAGRLLARDADRPVIVVMAPEADERARRLHDSVRAGPGTRVAHMNHPLDSLPLLRHLQAGGVVAMQLDRVARSTRHLEVPLFGSPFRLPEGPFQLAATAGCPMLTAFASREGYFDYQIHVGTPITLPRRPDRAILEAAARAAGTEMERFILAHPTQWFHFAPSDR